MFVYRQYFSFDEVESYIRLGLAVNGIGGGLLLGPDHDGGGINVLVKHSDGYRLLAEFEGHEYLLNPISTTIFKDGFQKINQYYRDIRLELPKVISTDNIKVIDCSFSGPVLKSKFLLLDSRAFQMLINKHSTRRYIDLINQMNSAGDCEINFKRDLLHWIDGMTLENGVMSVMVDYGENATILQLLKIIDYADY